VVLLNPVQGCTAEGLGGGSQHGQAQGQ